MKLATTIPTPSLWFIIIACLSAFTQRAAADEVSLYQLNQNQNDGGWGYPEAGDQYSAQPIMTGSLGTVTSINLLLQRIGNPGGVFHVEIWDDSEGEPGSLVATVGDIDLAGIPTTRSWVTLDRALAGLMPNTLHYVVINFKDATLGIGGTDTVRSYFSKQKPSESPEVGSTLIQLIPNGSWEPVPELIGVPAGEERLRIMSVAESDLDGFIGHEVSFSGRYYDFDNEAPPGAPISLGSARVGDEVEYVGRTIDVGGGVVFSAATFDLDAYTIDVDMAHLEGNRTDQGNFNGYIIEDRNGTLPDFSTVTVESASTSLFPDGILVSPNSIWIDIRGVTIPAGAFMRLSVTFAGSQSSPIPSLTPQSNGAMILEAPAIIGESYRFEQSSDLLNFTPIDNELTADSSFVVTHLMPTGSQMFYRVRLVE